MKFKQTNPLLLLDFYKCFHSEQYPKGLTRMVSYLTPRMSRVNGDGKLIIYSVQANIKKYFIDYFNEYFFSQPKEQVVQDYIDTIDNTTGLAPYEIKKISDLHDLGYLPIEIFAIEEGTRVPVKVPMIGITNTHKDFVWVVNTIETLLSCSLWHPMISANVGYSYRQIVDKYFDISVDNDVPRSRAMGDFSMRGQESLESATASSSAFLLSFLNTATVPAIKYLEQYYNCDCKKEPVGFGSISTEHSVMCSNFAIDGDEMTMVKRLLTEIYPKNSFSMVSDSYDYWNMVSNILPQCRQEIMEHEGTLLVRGDSGDPVDIICGTYEYDIVEFKEHTEEKEVFEYFKNQGLKRMTTNRDYTYGCLIGKKFYELTCERLYDFRKGEAYIEFEDFKEVEYTPEMKGTVQCLWDSFGGAINSKGFKVLDSHIKTVYGDSITQERATQIYEKLIKKGFASNNVVLGMGSFSMQCIEEDGVLKPYTRDTYGIAVKATYAEKSDGSPIMIFKNPKTDTGNFKKSQRGCCYVYEDENKEITYEDGLTFAEIGNKSNNLLTTVFKDGIMVKETSLKQIRDKLHNNKF